MDDKEVQFQIQTQFREHQQKLVYYIIALAVSAIAFSVYQTTDQALSFYQIPLAIAITFWALSIYCGLKFNKYIISGLHNNSKYIDIIKGNDIDIGNDPVKIKTNIKAFKIAIKINQKRTKWLFRGLNYFFYLGLILFLIWRILEMSQIKSY